MAPTVTDPISPVTIEYQFNTSTIISCTFTARPSVGDEAVTWYKDGKIVDQLDFSQKGTTITGVFPFAMEEGFQSDLEFKFDGPNTCDDVRLFDGDYHCDVTSNDNTDVYAKVITQALCKLFLAVFILQIDFMLRYFPTLIRDTRYIRGSK